MRRTETSTLAFLDVMACGLGAVILILVVLKQQAPPDTSPQTEPIVSAEQAEADLDNLQNELAALLAAQDTAKGDLAKQRQIVATMNASLEKAQNDLASANTKSLALDQAIASATSTLTHPQTETSSDAVGTARTTQPQYLVGLKVTGKKIFILLDRSASMTARDLIKIVQYKAGPGTARQQAEKWVNALNAVWWMTARAPKQSQIHIASFSNSTKFHTANWIGTSDSAALRAVKAEMASLVPHGSTNLEDAVAAAIKIGADSIYIITDGLPTAAPGGQTLLGLDGCGSKWFKRNQVTGECRVSLFQRVIAAAAGKPVRISIVLMPLEGDPDAAPLFSKWALSKGGILLSAARNWP